MLTSPDGTLIWAEAAGNASAPAIVFIHGLGCTAAAFDKQFEDLRLLKHLHLVRYEMRGHGRSGKPEDIESYQSIRHAEDFRVVCEAFQLHKPCMLGWSLGGCIAVDIVRYYGADAVSGIIYLGGSVLSLKIGMESCISQRGRALVASITSLDDEQLVMQGVKAFVEAFAADPKAIPLPIEFTLLGHLVLQPALVRHNSVVREQDDSKWLSEAKNIPILMIQGTKDVFMQYEIMIGWAKEIYNDVNVQMMQGVGHAPQFERTEETNRLILSFVTRVAQPASNAYDRNLAAKL